MPSQAAGREGHGSTDATTHHYRWMGSSRVVQTSLPSLSRPSSSQCTVAAWEVSLRSSRPRSAKRLASHMRDMCVTWGTCIARFVTWVTCSLHEWHVGLFWLKGGGIVYSFPVCFSFLFISVTTQAWGLGTPGKPALERTVARDSPSSPN